MSTSTHPLVEMLGVSKSFGPLQAVSKLDLVVEPGEVVGLLGPNGSGKTTSVRMLCGLLAQDSGTVRIAGLDVGQDPLQARRHIGFVPDGAPLYSNLSTQQHLQLVAGLHGLSQPDIQTESERLLTGLGLEGRDQEPVGRFSRGMRQKAALACALIHKPSLLILDEPLSGLDAPTTAVIKEVLRAWAERGGSVLYTSHLLDVVEKVCDRMIILNQGVLVAEGSLDELRQRAGQEGSLEQVFNKLSETEDPRVQAERLLGT